MKFILALLICDRNDINMYKKIDIYMDVNYQFVCGFH